MTALITGASSGIGLELTTLMPRVLPRRAVAAIVRLAQERRR